MPIQDSRHLPPTADQIEELTAAVIALGNHVRHLRHSVDEIEEELGWALRTKVLSQIPRPEFPCDQRLELVDDEQGSESNQRWEHACDPENDWCYPGEQLPATPTPYPESLPASARHKQSKLW